MAQMELPEELKDVVVGSIKWNWMEFESGFWKCGEGDEWCALPKTLQMSASTQLDAKTREEVDAAIDAWARSSEADFFDRLAPFCEELKPRVVKDDSLEGMDFKPMVRLTKHGFEVVFGFAPTGEGST